MQAFVPICGFPRNYAKKTKKQNKTKQKQKEQKKNMQKYNKFDQMLSN